MTLVRIWKVSDEFFPATTPRSCATRASCDVLLTSSCACAKSMTASVAACVVMPSDLVTPIWPAMLPVAIPAFLATTSVTVPSTSLRAARSTAPFK
jgi:hypothetical protein